MENSNAFFSIVDNDDIEIARDYFSISDEINKVSEDGTSLIFESIKNKHLKALSLLLLNGVDIDVKNNQGHTPIIKSIIHGFSEATSLLIYNDANLDLTDSSGRTALTYAIIKSDIDVIRLLLDNNIDHKIKDKYKNSPLIFATISNLDETGKLKLVIEQSKDIELLDQKIYHYYKELVQLLIAKDEDINYLGAQNKTALYYSIKKNNTIMTNVLLEFGADQFSSYSDNESALLASLDNENEEIFSMLLNTGADYKHKFRSGKTVEDITKVSGKETFDNIIQRFKGGQSIGNEVTIVKGSTLEERDDVIWLRENAASDQHSSEVSQKFVISSDMFEGIYGSVEESYDDDFDVDDSFHDPFDNIDLSDHSLIPSDEAEDTATLSKNKRMKTSDQGPSPEEKLFNSQDITQKIVTEKEEEEANQTAKKLFNDIFNIVESSSTLDDIADDDHDPFADFTPIEDIPEKTEVNETSDGSFEVTEEKKKHIKTKERVKKLPEKKKIEKKNVDQRLKNGRTRLILASSKGEIEIARFLVNEGANVNRRDFAGRTSIMYACVNGHKEIVKFLLEQKADLEIRDDKGYVALMHAVNSNKVKIVELLLDAGAKPDVRIKGKSTLMIAADNGFVDIVEMLLEKGVDPKVKDFKGKDAAKYARARGHKNLGDYLDQQRRRVVARF